MSLKDKKDNTLSVREIQLEDIDLIANYWLESDPAHLVGMGVDLDKLPLKSDLVNGLKSQINLPINEKFSFALIWLLNDKAIGHCNVNHIQFGLKANMHLHLWNSNNRIKGMGTSLLKLSLPIFFEKLDLQYLICEPYALNPAPNKTLERLGFEFIKEYTTIPGSLNFEQNVNQWKMTKTTFKK